MIFLFLFFFMAFLGTSLQARDQSSVVSISPSATLILDKPLEEFKATLALETNATLTGQMITFEGGVLQDADGSGAISARVSSNYICLEGNQVFKGTGRRMFKSLLISGTGNRLEGEVLPVTNIILKNQHTDLTLALLRTLDRNICLNGGTIMLEEKLHFGDGYHIEGPGTVHLEKYSLIFGAKDFSQTTSLYFDSAQDIELCSNVVLSSTLTFSGPLNYLVGNGNILDLSPGGCIIIERGSSLAFFNIILNNVSSSNLICLDNASSLTLMDTTWIQSNDFNFAKGALFIDGRVHMQGPYTFAYQTQMTSTINSNTTWLFDYGMTLSYDPSTSYRNLFFFENDSSTLCLKGTTLHITPTGMQLTNGCLLIDEDCIVQTEKETTGFGAGLEIGNLNSDHDMTCRILNASGLELAQGDLVYSNSLHDSWHMYNNAANLKINQGCRLYLKAPLDIEAGTLHLSSQGILQRDAGKEFTGSAHIF